MPLAPNHFIRGTEADQNGRLTPQMFGGWKDERLTAYVQGLLDKAAALPAITALPAGTQDSATEAFVYWQAFDAALTEVTFAPERADVERLGSVTHNRAAQIKTLKEDRNSYRAAFDQITDPPATRRRRRITSGSVEIERTS